MQGTILSQGSTIPPLSQNVVYTVIFLVAITVFVAVKAHGVPWVGLLKHKLKEQNNYIDGSFISSAVASQRVLKWAGSSNRARLLGIKFHPEWRHPNCTVMRWYDDQGATSRVFWTIEHRRDIHGPFYHEFLLLKLTDGAICRLERVGEGSRADAIRSTGCTANDLIQWFDEDDYAEFESEHPSVLLSKISFPSKYDILDVLSICYSIQNTNACKVYTLQRYNCYFLCLTVLAVLTRRAASWENKIAGDVWDSALARELARLSSLPAQEAKQTPMLRICAMLEPTDPHYPEPLFKKLNSMLYSGSGLVEKMREAVHSSLWAFPWESETPIETIASCISPLVIDEYFNPTQLRSILMRSLQNPDQPPASNDAVVEFYSKEYFERMYRVLFRRSQLFSNLCQMMEIERPISFRTMVLSRMVQFLFVVLVMFNNRRAVMELDRSLKNLFGIKAGASYFKLFNRLKAVLFFSGYPGYALAMSVVADDRYGKLLMETMGLSARDHHGPIMASVLNTLESKGMLEQDANAKLVLTSMLTGSDSYYLERSFVLSTLLSTLKIIVQAQPKNIIVDARDDSYALPVTTGALEFQQQYIQPRMHAHAERVARHHLAAAPLVSMDIHNTMAAVWKSLPPGFGGVNAASSLLGGEAAYLFARRWKSEAWSQAPIPKEQSHLEMMYDTWSESD